MRTETLSPAQLSQELRHGRSPDLARPLVALAFALKAGNDLLTTLRLTREEWADNKALCSWCQVATLVSAATFALSLPEARKAAAQLA